MRKKPETSKTKEAENAKKNKSVKINQNNRNFWELTEVPT